MNKKTVLIIFGVGVLAVISAMLIVVSGQIVPFKYPMTPEDRLQANPDLIAACQYEWWKNTTHVVPVVNAYDIKNSTKTTTNWVCYYRDKPTYVQNIGEFETKMQAANYIWYYYENGQYPLIWGQP